MDNVTHTLTGLALARAGLNRFAPYALPVLLLSANAPDGDIVMVFRGGFAYFEAHRGYSHSLICLPALAAVCVGVIAVAVRRRVAWVRLWLLACIGIASHLLLDWTNTYGVRLLLPFSSRWFHLDVNALYDGLVLIILGFAAVWPLFSRLVSSEIGERSKPASALAISALVLFAGWDAVRASMHSRAVAQLSARMYDGYVPVRAAAFPQPFSLTKWTGAVESPGAFLVVPVDAVGQLDLETARTFYKSVSGAQAMTAKRSEVFRYFSYFARFPVWSSTPVNVSGRQLTRVELTDLRFGSPGAGSFHCVALEDSQNRLLQSWFTFGPGEDLGWGDSNASASHPQ